MREVQFSIYDDNGDGSYRWIVRESVDFGGCVDLVYESDGDGEVGQTFTGLDAVVAEEIALSIFNLTDFFEHRKTETRAAPEGAAK
jgi:hypothetical protein